MTADPAILAARARATAAKARLEVSMERAKSKLSPRSLATDVVESAKDKAVEAAQTGLQVARDRPVAAAAVAGAIGIALARKPLLGWLGALFGRNDATGDDDAS